MPIDVLTLNAADVTNVLALHESHFIEAKATAVTPAKLTRTLSAFANTDGGELYLGLSESNGTFTWSGFNDPEDANAHLAVFEPLFPLGDGFLYEFFVSDSAPGYLLHVIVAKSASVRVASDGDPFIRRGAQNLRVSTPEERQRLERSKGITSFESERVPIGTSAITNSMVTLEFMLSAIPLGEPDTWLRKQRVIVDEKPTVAGVLLYDDLPQAALPKRSSVKIYRYKTSEEEGTRETLDGNPLTIEGPLYTQIAEAVSTTVSIVESVKVLDESGLSSVEYPFDALHEIITNALIHRDYGVADDVHIRVFDNRIEVESPGRLAGHVSPENILRERFARNGNIVRLINKFPDPPNKDVGEGLNTAFNAMKQLKLKDPVIVETETTVLVSIRHERLAAPEQMILDYLADHDEVNNRVVRQLTGIGSENKVKTIFQGLMKSGDIERVPGKAGNLAAYRLVETTQ